MVSGVSHLRGDSISEGTVMPWTSHQTETVHTQSSKLSTIAVQFDITILCENGKVEKGNWKTLKQGLAPSRTR
jgi:hypothetical protein